MKIAAAAGRTDAGVHAKEQVVNFKTASSLSLERIQAALNAFLPSEIAVKKIEAVPPAFHARYHARSKTYEYLVFNSKIRSPLLNGRVYRFPYPLHVGRMREAARHLVGQRDFKAFSASSGPASGGQASSTTKNTVRTIRRIRITQKGKLIRFVIEADGFLYRMVRSIVGTLLEVGRGSLSLQDFSESFKKRRRSVHSAPPQALTLISVKYAAG